MSDEKTEAREMFDLALTQANPGNIGENPYLIVPEYTTVKDMEKYLPQPTRKRGNVRLDSVDSFASYVNDHKGDGTRVFADADVPEVVAVLDHHSASTPGWGDHKVCLVCRKSRQWHLWTEHNRRKMPQAVFAEFLEDNLPDIAEPPGSELVRICSDLKEDRGLRFQSGINLQDGMIRLEFKEEKSGTKGGVNVPAEFILGVPVFENGDKWKVTARLRYRIDRETGSLSFHYALNQPEDVFEEAFREVIQSIAAETELEVLRGRP